MKKFLTTLHLNNSLIFCIQRFCTNCAIIQSLFAFKYFVDSCNSMFIFNYFDFCFGTKMCIVRLTLAEFISSNYFLFSIIKLSIFVLYDLFQFFLMLLLHLYKHTSGFNTTIENIFIRFF